ncbi:MAG: hypothetical protein R3Y62_08340, partial [Eubacteriales bacterium]
MAERPRRQRQKKPKSEQAKKLNILYKERANRTILSRTFFLMVCGLLAFIPLVYTLFQLMIVDHDTYEGMAIDNQTRTTTLSADRGKIYDTNMNILATAITVENVFIDPNEIERESEANPNNLKLIAAGLSELLDVDSSFIYEQAEDTAMMYKVIKRKISTDLGDEVRQFIVDNDIKGVYLEPDSQRSYPYT